MSPRSSLQARGGKDDLKSRRAEIVAVLSHDSCTQCARCQLHTPGHRVTGRIRIRRMQVTLGLIKPTVCAYRPNVLRALRRIQALNSIEVGQKKEKYILIQRLFARSQCIGTRMMQRHFTRNTRASSIITV